MDSEGNPKTVKWKCKYCPREIPAVSIDIVLPICPFCGKSQLDGDSKGDHASGSKRANTVREDDHGHNGDAGEVEPVKKMAKLDPTSQQPEAQSNTLPPTVPNSDQAAEGTSGSSPQSSAMLSASLVSSSVQVTDGGADFKAVQGTGSSQQASEVRPLLPQTKEVVANAFTNPRPVQSSNETPPKSDSNSTESEQSQPPKLASDQQHQKSQDSEKEPKPDSTDRSEEKPLLAKTDSTENTSESPNGAKDDTSSSTSTKTQAPGSDTKLPPVQQSDSKGGAGKLNQELAREMTSGGGAQVSPAQTEENKAVVDKENSEKKPEGKGPPKGADNPANGTDPALQQNGHASSDSKSNEGTGSTHSVEPKAPKQQESNRPNKNAPSKGQPNRGSSPKPKRRSSPVPSQGAKSATAHPKGAVLVPSKSITQKAVATPEKSKPTSSTDGIRQTNENAIAITFNVILPWKSWLWDKDCKLALRFGHKELGVWEENVGMFEEHRKFDEDYIWMQCTLNIDFNLLSANKIIAYKYVVISQKWKDGRLFEFLHDSPQSGEHVNRCLQVPKERCCAKGKYYLYDGMIFPEVKSESFRKSFIGGIKSGWSQFTQLFWRQPEKSGQEEVKDSDIEKLAKPLAHEEAQARCLDMFSVTHRKKMISLDLSKLNFVILVNNISHIHEQLNRQRLCMDNARSNKERIARLLPKAFKNWLLNVAKGLQIHSVESSSDNGKRISCVLVLLGLLKKIDDKLEDHDKNPNEYMHLFSMLYLRPEFDSTPPKLTDLNIVMSSFIPEPQQQEVADTLVHFVNKVLKTTCCEEVEWTYVVPWIHFLKKKVKPLQRPGASFVWNDPDVDLVSVRNRRLFSAERFVDAIVSGELEPLLQLDPLLLPLLVYACPTHELPSLFAVIAPSVSASWLHHSAGHLSVYEHHKLVDVLLTVIKQLPKEYPTILEEVDVIYSNVKETFKTATTRSDKDMLYFQKLIVLFFYAIAKYIEYCPAKASRVCTEMFNCVQETLSKKCIPKLFPNGFGNASSKRGIHVETAKKELMVCQEFAKIDTPVIFKEQWLACLCDVLKTRVEIIECKYKIELVYVLESMDNAHTFVKDLLIDAVVRSFEEGSEKLRQLHESTVKYRELVEKVVAKILNKKYPNRKDSISLCELLEWEFWPICITIYHTDLVKKKESTFYHETLCACADSVLMSTKEKILKGTVTVKELTMIEGPKQQFLKLCAANLDQYHENMERILNHRMSEVRAFKRYLLNLQKFCFEMQSSRLQIQGLPELIQQVEQVQDHSSKPIKSLCCIEEGHVTYTGLPSARPLEPILTNYYFLSDKFTSRIFVNIWLSKLDSLANARLSIPELISKVWDPIYAECCELVDSMYTGEIQLKRVESYLRHVPEGDTYNHFEQFYQAIQACKGSQPAPSGWIKSAVDKFELYKSLSKQAEAAKSVMKLKESFQLAEGFNFIEGISKKDAASAGNAHLKDMDEKMDQTKTFLAHFSPERLECLQVFLTCLDLVQWIRDLGEKGISDLHNFVSIALHMAAGEGDFSSDRLSRLKIVGSGFKPLIYDLVAGSDLATFEKCCSEVWEAIKEDRSLNTYLKSCNEHLEWYKSVKETQGTVEVTSYGQMNNIFQYGCYFVGSGEAHICHNYSDVIVLKLKKSKSITKIEYNLEELRDLESKLVLITGSKAEYRENVDIFIDVLHSVCRIAEVLLALQQAGNVKYTGWKLLVPCSEDKHLVNTLQVKAKKMEHELLLWKETVKDKREEFYELNYYTTLQLLTLRKELGTLTDDEASVSPDVLALLHSISDDVTATDVSAAVSRVARESMEKIPSADNSEASIPELGNEDSFSPCMESSKIESGSELSLAEEDAAQEEALTDVQQREMIADICSRLHCSEELVRRSFKECPGKEKNRLDYEKWCKEKLSDEDPMRMEALTEEQREEVEDICSQLECSEELAMRSFKECPEGKDRLDWCNETLMREEGEWNITIESSESESESDVEESEAPNASVPEKVIISSSVLSTTLNDFVPGIIEIAKPMRAPVDGNHPDVVELVKADYPLKDSIRAVKMYPKIEEAQMYLDSTAEEGSEGKLIPTTSRGLGPEDILEWECGGDLILYLDPNAEQNYLKLEQLGSVLALLSDQLPVKLMTQRSFPKYLTEGSPNLLVVPQNDILMTALTLYMENSKDHPLPTPEEVLICTSSTTAEEIQLFWMTAINDPGYKHIFCMVHAEKLSYHISDQALTSLHVLSQGKKDYRLVLLCSNQDEEKSHFIAKLHLLRRVYPPQAAAACKSYLASKFCVNRGTCSQASTLDHENSCVRIISSRRSGMGKSLYVQRLAEKLQKQLKTSEPVHVTVPLHGPVVTPDTVLDLFKEHWKKPTSYIYHIDVASNILWQVDTILFSLLILRGLTDSKGRVWCCHPDQLYVVEVTSQDNISGSGEDDNQTLTLLDILPCLSCLSPKQTVERPGDSILLMDEDEFCSHSYQRVYQYLRRHSAGSNLDKFSFTGGSEGSPQDCLNHLLRYCGVKDPSWSEIRHFVKFLDYQLESCEKSVFTDSTFVGDVMKGLKDFVVKFMIAMSRDFSTSSLCMEVALEMKEVVQGDHIEQYQISQRKLWEQSPHPYIFFNQDRVSITFVGFTVDKRGNLLHPTEKRVLESNIMTPELYAGLKHNRVNFQDNYTKWSKATMIEKISAVMGVDPYDPDESYVLTADNIIKILAIQMRFRCGIPVVIMGETGCGKTRLIRYMCDLARQGKDQNNMLILKVHGGISEEDIIDFIQQAEEVSDRNCDSSLDTVVFFDEANTTDAIGLIKEIMCDRRINGKPVSEGLKFIAACNPYKKHDDKMIERLDSAGLGFFVKTTETQQRLGKIPLRHLVYRVLDLPPSMRPLVYDFGQLNIDAEEYYIKQIVKDHIRNNQDLRYQLDSEQISDSIATILSKSQQYMRTMKDECSYVSLRDVERAMLVFEYMYGMMDRLGPLIDEWANKDHEDPMDEVTSMDNEAEDDYENSYDDRDDYDDWYEDYDDRDDHEDYDNPEMYDDYDDREDYPEDYDDQVQEDYDDYANEEMYEDYDDREDEDYDDREAEDYDDYQRDYEDDYGEDSIGYPASEDIRPAYVSPDRVARALILSLSVCYHARLQRREEYETSLVSHFTGRLKLAGGCEQFRNEIKWCQEVFLDNMCLGDNIARNAALRENVFMMAVCIELRIPLFLVGKPGSSKSLAKSIVSESMKGKDARNDLLKEFKDVEIFSYQCSQLSTSESIIEVFDTAGVFQGKQGISTSVAVVVLDEVGLAEDSPNLPLKALHPLLEDGTEGAKKDYIDEIKPRQERVAFIGISNWALDPAKMNRGVMVTRADPNVNELILSARGICSNEEDDPIRELLQPYFKHLAKAYIGICEKQKREFFGLRDFYSLIKMLYYMCKKSNLPPTNAQLEHAIKRNFGGLRSKKLNPYQEFLKRLPKAKKSDVLTDSEKIDPILNPDCSRLGLIKSSLNFREHNPHGENRYVLFLTQNYAALEVLKNNFLSSDRDQMPPFILFGSSFPKDKEYTQVCRNINQIKICMETGRTVILLNLENLYESLYDLLNQYYIVWGTTKYVDLGLQTHRVRCRVEDTFKLILIAEKATVYRKFPTPLINRMEKHFVLTSSILKEWQEKVLRRLENWLEDFVRDSKFSLKDAFIGYQKDTPASVVFQASNMLLAACAELKDELPGAAEKWSDVMKWSQASTEDLYEENGDSRLQEQPVYNLSKFLVLETAAPDAIVRLERTALAHEKEAIMQLYFEEQHHNSLTDYLTHHLHSAHRERHGLLMQVTTHSHLLSQRELKIVQTTADVQVSSFFLHEFDTELDFSNKVGPMFLFGEGSSNEATSDRLVVIQCDSYHIMGDLIACARYRIHDFKAKAGNLNTEQVTHVLFIIYLPQHSVDSSLVGFQGDPWISSHIDDLRVTTDASVLTNEAIQLSISELFCPIICSQDATGDSAPLSRPIRVRHPLYRRLHMCIQQAVSRLLDLSTKRSTKRVQILVNLIPREPPSSLDFDDFHGILVCHMFGVLQEYDEERVDEKEWVINEAMNPKNLQHGGTFSNALSRKVDRIIVPILSEIIASIDKNYNLDLIDPKAEDTHISQFWLDVFRDSRVMQFSYADMAPGRDQVPGIGAKKVAKDFKCRLPFSWLIYEAVKSQWHNASSSCGDDVSQVHKQLCLLLEPTAIGEVITRAGSVNLDEFYERYLHDFVRLAHQCNHKNLDHETQEYELISAALDALVHGDIFRATESLLHKIAALYMVYKMNESQILWFGQLVSLSPGVLIHLLEKNISGSTSTEMVLHLRAVEKILENLKLQKHPAENLVPWLNEVRLIKGVVTSIINLPSQHELKAQSRRRWNGIQLLQLFVEHISLRHLSSAAFLNRLKLYVKPSTDFLQVSTLEMVQTHLNALNTAVAKKKLIQHKEELRSFKNHCHEYFVEVVAALCFGGQQAPEAALIEMLMDIIFTKNLEMVSPLKDGKSDKVSVVKSSLLQLLLEHNSASVKHYYEQYFDQSRKALREGEDQNLCLLFIQCFEDDLHKKWAGELLPVTNILREAYHVLRDYKASQDVNIVHYLEGIAGVRFAMMEIACLLHSHYESQSDQQLDLTLMQLAEEVSSDPAINTVDFGDRGNGVVGPAMYLLKLLVRLYGFPCLKQAIRDYNWILPRGLQYAAEQEKVIDPFVIYKEKIRYTSLRDLISSTLFGRQMEGLNEAAQSFDIKEAAVLLLAMYEVITLSYALPNQQVDVDLLDKLDQFALNMKSFSFQMQQVARLLLTNKQGGVLGQMCISPELAAENKSLGAIVIHSVAVISSNSRLNILQPFLHMLTNPAALANCYLPTMAQDNLPELQHIVGGRVYECPRGHRYFIGDCGQPWVESTCNTCGSRIGGRNHELASQNREGTGNDTTQSGHILGDPNSVSGPPLPERSLSPPTVCIVRAIMHSAFLWFSCHRTEMYGEIAAVVKPPIHPQSLPEFFWRHLRKDIEQLSRATGKSPDESAIIVHLVLQNVLLKEPPTFAEDISSLGTKAAREEWERKFYTCYIHPVLANLDQQLAVSMDLVAKDNRQEHDQLFYVAYEKVEVSTASVEPHLWSYRQRISLEHLGQTLQEEELKKKCPILFEFLQVEPSVRATQYLPDIVRLQRSLHDAFHHRLHRRDAMKLTIGDFISSLKNESVRQEYAEQVESLKKAWILVGIKLKTNSQFHLKDEDFLPAITGDTPLEYLIPTASGAGVLTTALVDYLIRTHNAFIDRCCSLVEQKRDGGWIKHEVPITHIHRCHLLDYERQIVSMVLSHCCYSLKVGEAHTVQYDHQALEKHLLDRFIYGKPIIRSDIPQVAYRNDMYTIVAFNVVRKKVKPQEKLDSQTKKEILAELRTPDLIRENLDVVDIVLGFLSSGGGKPDKPLGEYVDKVLKMKRRPFSKKAHNSCRLRHILSLWETLSVELSKMTWLSRQEPFDTLNKKYLSPLDERDGNNQVVALNDCLRSFDLDKLLGALFECIETYVKYSPDNELQWSLRDDVLAQDLFVHLDLDPHFFEKFPASITLDQTVAAWKHIVMYQDKLMQD